MNQSARIRLLSFAACLVACLACDQATKQVASHALGGIGPVSVAGDLVRFEAEDLPTPDRQAHFGRVDSVALGLLVLLLDLLV